MHPITAFSGFFFFAVSYNLLGPLVPDIMASTGLSLSDSGMLVTFQQIGSFIAIAASLLLMKRLRQSTVMRIGYGFLIGALILMGLTEDTGLMYILYMVFGIGAFLIDSGTNAALTGDFYEKRATYIPLLHFCYSAGAIATGYLLLPFKGGHWRWAYTLVGVVLTIILLAGPLVSRIRKTMGVGKQRAASQIGPQIKEPAKAVGTLLGDPGFIIYTLVISLYMGIQLLCATWIPVYVELELGQPGAITATSLTMFWIGTAISRLIVGPLLNNGAKPYLLSTIGMVLAGLSLIVATLTPNLVLVLSAITLCGFFSGATIPMYLVVTSTWYPGNTAFISLSYIFSGTIGRMLFPWLATRIATDSSLGFSLRISSVLFFLSAVCIVWVQRLSRRKPVY